MKKIMAFALALTMLVGLISCAPAGPTPPSDAQSNSLPSSSLPLNSDLPDSSLPSSSKPSSSLPSANSSIPDSSLPSSSVSSNNYYCYSFLTDRQKEYYTRMASAVSELDSHWIVLGDADDNYLADISVARESLSIDRPDIFWMPPYFSMAKTTDGKAAIRFSKNADTGEDSEDSPAYLITRSEKMATLKKLNDVVKSIVSEVSATDPYEIELQLHDLLCQRVTYSANDSDPMVFTAYGALVNGQALCEGYARAMQLLLRQFGITSTLVTGTARGEGHMWNLVKIAGEWYHLDATWNDLSSVSHEYFNVTTADIQRDHVISSAHTALSPDALSSGVTSFNIGIPSCSAGAQNYFVRTGFIFYKDAPQKLLDRFVKHDGDMLEIKFATAEERKDFYDNAATRIEELNSLLKARHPDAKFYIGGYSISTSVLRLYKTEYNKTTD